MTDELGPGFRTVHQLAVFAAGRVIPATDGQQNLDTELFERRHFTVEN